MITSSRRLLALITGGLIVASVANVFWETRVLPKSQYGDRIVALREDGRLITLTGSVTNPYYTKDNFLLTTALLDTAKGGVLIAPDPTLVHEYTMNSLALMSVRIEDYQSELSDEEAEQLLEFAQFEGDGRVTAPGSDLVHFYLITDPDGPRPAAMRLLFFEGSAFYVDEALFVGLRS